MTKRYFAAHHDGKTYFRASDTRAYRSLRFENDRNWGMSAQPGSIAVQEINQAEYTSLVARKAKRIAAQLAALETAPRYRGYGSKPTESWVVQEPSNAEIDAHIARLAAADEAAGIE
jgi:hypothetical protein